MARAAETPRDPHAKVAWLQEATPVFDDSLGAARAREAEAADAADPAEMLEASRAVVAAEQARARHAQAIERARAAADEADATARREAVLAVMAEHAQAGEEAHAEVLELLGEIRGTLSPLLARLADARSRMRTARREFKRSGAGLIAWFGHTDVPRTWSPERAEAAEAEVAGILAELEGRGVRMSAVRSCQGELGDRRGLADTDRPVPLVTGDPLDSAIWQAVRALEVRDGAA